MCRGKLATEKKAEKNGEGEHEEKGRDHVARAGRAGGRGRAGGTVSSCSRLDILACRNCTPAASSIPPVPNWLGRAGKTEGEALPWCRVWEGRAVTKGRMGRNRGMRGWVGRVGRADDFLTKWLDFCGWSGSGDEGRYP